jgi:hypothetical protein
LDNSKWDFKEIYEIKGMYEKKIKENIENEDM